MNNSLSPRHLFTLSFLLATLTACTNQTAALRRPRGLPIADGYAQSSVNTVIFRHSSITCHDGIQYTAFYDDNSRVILAKRQLSDSTWQTNTTDLTGNTRDAHNTISLGVDGAGILHMSWDHHGNNLNYVRTIAPGSLDLTPRLHMDGLRETQVTYPEFYNLPDGDLLFLYRVGSSGNGDLVLKRYHTATQTWSTLQQNLIAGEGRQNAYPEFCVGPDGTLHLGWVWRRTPDVATNHNICYARSTDGGKTWTDSKGNVLALPITAATGEIAIAIPENSDLINQTTIAADAAGHPYIATYFRPAGQTVPQFQIVYHDGHAWHTAQVGHRTTPFSLSGGGTKRIPISRPLILVDSSTTPPRTFVIFRDAERHDRITLTATTDITQDHWTFTDLTPDSVGSWEPSCDPVRWSRDHILDLFVQKTDQLDSGDNITRTANIPPTQVSILEYRP